MEARRKLIYLLLLFSVSGVLVGIYYYLYAIYLMFFVVEARGRENGRQQ